MADIKPAAIGKLPMESVDEGSLRLGVEINHDLPAKDHVEFSGHWPGAKQVELPKTDQFMGCARHKGAVGLLPGAFPK